MPSVRCSRSVLCGAKRQADNFSDSENLYDARCWQCESIPVREFFAADVEGIEGVGAVGAVFEEVFFGLCELFAGLVFAEAVASAAYTS